MVVRELLTGAALLACCGVLPPNANPASAAGSGQDEAMPVQPRIDEVRLAVGEKLIKPIKAIGVWVYARRAGTIDIAVSDDLIKAFDAKSGDLKWEVSLKEAGPQRLIASDAETIYLVPPKPSESPPPVRRMEANTGRWLDPLKIQLDPPKGETSYFVSSIITSREGSSILCEEIVNDRGNENHGELRSYRVTRFASSQTSHVWTQEFPSVGKKRVPWIWLRPWGIPAPDYAVDEPVPLTTLEDRLVVCAGAREDILCLAMGSGRTLWKIPRLWEIRRGFIGPSVWAHYLGRYGMDKSDLRLAEEGPGKNDQVNPEHLQELRKSVKEARERMEAEEGAIVAGPVAVPLEGSRRNNLFVVTMRGEKTDYSGYVADTVIYELSQSGEPIGTAVLPRMVNPRQFKVAENAVIWACSRGAFVRIAPYWGRLADLGGHLGEHDMLCRIEWYRQPDTSAPRAWLSSHPAGDLTAFSGTHAFRTTGGGFITNQGDRIYRFPMAMVDLKSGVLNTLQLHVPLEGDAPLPKKNFVFDRDTGTRALRPYLIGVAWMQVMDDALEIVIGTEDKKASAVRFSLSEILSAR